MLSVVPTPIGNRQDITLRAIEVLRAADLVAADGRLDAADQVQVFAEHRRRVAAVAADPAVAGHGAAETTGTALTAVRG